MRPHPQIGPYIRRPTRESAELIIQLEPVDGDPVMPLRIALDARSGPRLLADLMDAWCALWMDGAIQPGSDRATTPDETDHIARGAPLSP